MSKKVCKKLRLISRIRFTLEMPAPSQGRQRSAICKIQITSLKNKPNTRWQSCISTPQSAKSNRKSLTTLNQKRKDYKKFSISLYYSFCFLPVASQRLTIACNIVLRKSAEARTSEACYRSYKQKTLGPQSGKDSELFQVCSKQTLVNKYCTRQLLITGHV